MAKRIQDGRTLIPLHGDAGKGSSSALPAFSQNYDLLLEIARLKEEGLTESQIRAMVEAAFNDKKALPPTPVEKKKSHPARPTAADKLLDARGEQSAVIYGDREQDIRYLHVVLAQCGLPYKDPGKVPFYQRRNGNLSLLLTPGLLVSPDGEPVAQGLPYGPKPRLLMLHLCTEAIRTNSQDVEVGDSMSALMHDLGLAVTGGQRGTIRTFKEQLNRLAATRVQLGRSGNGHGTTINPPQMIEQFDVWFPSDPSQKTLWPSTLKLSKAFFDDLRSGGSFPVDLNAVRGLQSSAMKLDVYTWLAHRLCRVPANRPAVISWAALKGQFGQDYADTSDGRKGFRRDFRDSLAAVKQVYRDANISETADGNLELRQSKPPVSRNLLGKSTRTA